MDSFQLPQDVFPIQPHALWLRKQFRPFVDSVLEMAGEKRGSTPFSQAASANVAP